MLHETAIDLPAPIPEPLLADVLDKLAHASAHVRRCTIDDHRTRISIVLDDARHAPAAARAVRDTVAAMVRGYREVEAEVLWRHAATPRHAAPVWDELVAAGLLHPEAPGCVALLGDACRVALALDAAFARIAHVVFAATPHQYPTLLPIATLERCDYFASFPHHLTFAPHVTEDVHAITRLGEAPVGERGAAIARALAPPSHVLSPSVCFHTYAALAGCRIGTNQTFTAVQRCFRWEAGSLASCERLWDFTMRELVFVGEPAWVEAQRQVMIEEVARLVTRLELEAWIETASDPFFIGQFASKRYFQRLRRAKLELRLRLPYANASLSAASFNVHDDFFGRAFAITDATTTAPVSTGCFGAGIERWVWALFAQHGPRIADWPGAVQEWLGR